MSYVIAATYAAIDGRADEVLHALESMVGPSRSEPGCLEYRAHRSVEEPNVFFIYEEYVSADAFTAHSDSPHFQRHIKEGAWPALASRSVVRAQPI